MALILLYEEVIELTARAVMCVKNDRICDIIFQLYVSAWCQIIHLTMARTESENSRLVPFSATKKLPWGKWLPRPQKWMEKNSDKSHGSTGMFPHQFGRFFAPSGPSSQWKFNSLKFFQPQGCRHSWLWISQPSRLGYSEHACTREALDHSSERIQEKGRLAHKALGHSSWSHALKVQCSV